MVCEAYLDEMRYLLLIFIIHGSLLYFLLGKGNRTFFARLLCLLYGHVKSSHVKHLSFDRLAFIILLKCVRSFVKHINEWDDGQV